MNVDPGDYDYIRGQVGLDASFAVTDNIYPKLCGAYNYEFGDRNAEMMVMAQSLGGLKTRVADDEESRHSGSAGVGVGYILSEGAFIGLDYDTIFSNKYLGHQVAGWSSRSNQSRNSNKRPRRNYDSS